jgi:hypothetical protein
MTSLMAISTQISLITSVDGTRRIRNSLSQLADEAGPIGVDAHGEGSVSARTRSWVGGRLAGLP